MGLLLIAPYGIPVSSPGRSPIPGIPIGTPDVLGVLGIPWISSGEHDGTWKLLIFALGITKKNTIYI